MEEKDNPLYNFQLNKISKKAFAKERGKFMLYFLVILLIIIFFLYVVFQIKEPLIYVGIPSLYLFATSFSIREMNKDYRLTPAYLKACGNHIEVCYEHECVRMSIDEIDYVAQSYTRHRYGIHTKGMFRGYNKGEMFRLRYEYLEENYLIKNYIKEKFIDKKDACDMEFLKRESKAYELKGKRIGHVRIENIKSLKLASEWSTSYVELHVYNDKNKKYVSGYAGKRLASVIIKCYKIEALYRIPFKWTNYSYIPFFEGELSEVYKRN
jgi:hypothetical protein